MIQNAQTLEFEDFSGGITDDVIAEDRQSYADADNLLITDNKKLYTRPGSVIYDQVAWQIPAGSQRIGSLIDSRSLVNLAIQSARNVYTQASSVWTTHLGPTGNPVFGAGSSSSLVSWAEWKGHLYLTNDAGSEVMRLFKDGSGVVQVRNAGLPAIPDELNYVEATVVTNAITLHNAIRDKFLSHLNDFSHPDDGGAYAPNVTSGSATFDLVDAGSTDPLVPGMVIVCTSFPAGTRILSIAGTVVTASANATTTGTPSVRFYHLADPSAHEAIDTATKALLCTSQTAIAANGSSTLTGFTTVAGITVGQRALGIGIPANTTVTAVDAGLLTVTLSAAATVSLRGIFDFYTAPTSEATLYTAVGALLDAYSNHTEALAKVGGTDGWHLSGDVEEDYGHGPYSALSSPYAPESLQEAIERLNDLKRVLNWHSYAQAFHYSRGSNLITASDLDDLTSGYTVEPSFAEAFALLNELKTAFNAHIADTTLHRAADTVAHVSVPDATDLSSFFQLLHHLRYAYHRHWNDGRFEHFIFSANTTSGNSYLAGILPINSGNFTENTTVLGTTAGNPQTFEGYIFGSGIPAGATVSIHETVLTGSVTSGSPTLTFTSPASGLNATYANASVSGPGIPAGTKVSVNGFNSITLSANATAAVTSGTYVFTFAQISTNATATASSVPITVSKSQFHHGQDETTAILPFVEADEINVLNDPTFFDLVPSSAYESLLSGPETDLATVKANLDALYTAYSGHNSGRAHALQSTHTVKRDELPTFGTFSYAVHSFYEYEVGATTHQDFGATLVKGPFESGSPTDENPVVISGLPVIANGATSNYDTATIKHYIYRTEDGGTIFRKVGEVTNGVTTFNDTLEARSWSSGQLLYTEGGVVDNDPPPVAKYLHIVNDICFYANVTEDGEAHPTRVRQSLPGDPDSCPGDFYVDLDEDITGISSAKSRVVAFSDSATYRLEGGFDDLGRGSIASEKISNTVGCINNAAIVRIDEGLVFPAKDGFYFSDGYSVLKISENLNTTYAKITSTTAKKAQLRGTYDKLSRRVIWACQWDDASSDNDLFIVLHLKYGIRPRSSFTTWSGGASFAPSAVGYYRDELIRGDRRGYLFKHNPTYTTDPAVDTTVDADEWATQTVIHDFRSLAHNYGSNLYRKMASWVSVKARNQSNLTLQLVSNNDDGRSIKPLKVVRFRGNVVWGEPNVWWGDADMIWNFEGFIEEKRRFPSGGLRFSNKQIRITNGKVPIINSDSTSTATLDAVAKSVTLDDGVTFDWPEECVNYSIAFADDGYVVEYPITSLPSADVLTYDDTDLAPLTSGVKEWVIRGYPKSEILHLQSYTVQFVPMTASLATFRGGTQGENT